MQENCIKDLFTSNGIKVTKQRELIFDALKHSDTPVTAEQLFLKLKSVDSLINLSTVYRSLNIFVEKKLVIESFIPEEKTSVFEINRMEHKHYLICINCKKVMAIDNCPVEEYEKSLEKSTGFDIKGHKLEIFGYCPECRLKK